MAAIDQISSECDFPEEFESRHLYTVCGKVYHVKRIAVGVTRVYMVYNMLGIIEALHIYKEFGLVASTVGITVCVIGIAIGFFVIFNIRNDNNGWVWLAICYSCFEMIRAGTTIVIGGNCVQAAQDLDPSHGHCNVLPCDSGASKILKITGAIMIIVGVMLFLFAIFCCCVYHCYCDYIKEKNIWMLAKRRPPAEPSPPQVSVMNEGTGEHVVTVSDCVVNFGETALINLDDEAQQNKANA